MCVGVGVEGGGVGYAAVCHKYMAITECMVVVMGIHALKQLLKLQS